MVRREGRLDRREHSVMVPDVPLQTPGMERAPRALIMDDAVRGAGGSARDRSAREEDQQ